MIEEYYEVGEWLSLADLHSGLARVFIFDVAAEAASCGHFLRVYRFSRDFGYESKNA